MTAVSTMPNKGVEILANIIGPASFQIVVCDIVSVMRCYLKSNEGVRMKHYMSSYRINVLTLCDFTQAVLLRLTCV
jgi:hypothetical protein